jgi:hypothetical protein
MLAETIRKMGECRARRQLCVPTGAAPARMRPLALGAKPLTRARLLACPRVLPARPRAGDKIELDVDLGSESSDLLQQMEEGAAMARGK